MAALAALAFSACAAGAAAQNVKPMATSGIAEATLRAAQDELDASMRKPLGAKPHRFLLTREAELSGWKCFRTARI